MNTLKTHWIAIGLSTALAGLMVAATALAQDAHRPHALPAHVAAPHALPAHVAAPHAATAAHTTAPGRGTAAPHAAPPRAGAHPAAPRPSRGARIEGQVNLNTATAEELMRIPGIGPVKAQAVLSTRARQPGGRFARLEDVLRSRGIGRTTLRRLRDVLVLTGPTTLRVVASPATAAAPSHDDDI